MPREPTAGRFSQVNANARRAGALDEVMVLPPVPVSSDTRCRSAAFTTLSALQNEAQMAL
jgi:hypothetical protein